MMQTEDKTLKVSYYRKLFKVSKLEEFKQYSKASNCFANMDVEVKYNRQREGEVEAIEIQSQLLTLSNF